MLMVEIGSWTRDLCLGDPISKIAYISTVIGNFPEKISRQVNFDEFYPFLSTDSQKILEIYQKKIAKYGCFEIYSINFRENWRWSSKMVMIFGISILQSPWNVYSGLCNLQKIVNLRSVLFHCIVLIIKNDIQSFPNW
jgi:hypothetical protein